jgi:chloride channel 3/4/5
VTKAVGDFLGTRGIADETIRFNGYPILEKEEHGIDVSGQCSGCYTYSSDSHVSREVSEVMKKDLDTLFASGMLVSDVGKR